MTQPAPEEILASLRLQPPSAAYSSRTQVWTEATPHSRQHKWPWALAAALMLSLVMNVVQYQQRIQDRGQAVAGESQAVAQSPAQKPSSGYSYVASDASPDGLHRSITVTWENKS